MQSLANLFLIGAMKSGTTSLANLLASHPEVFVSTPKETHYFVEQLNLKNGPIWYDRLFSHAQHESILVDASTTYSMLPNFDGVVDRIAEYNRSARFVYIIRDPFTRIISHYRHMVRWHGEERRLLDAVEKSPHWIDYCDYGMQIQPYISKFGRASVFCMTLEAFSANPQAEFSKLCTWLGIQPMDTINPTLLLSNKTPQELRVTRRGFHYLARNPIFEPIKRCAPYKIKKALWRAATRRLLVSNHEKAELHQKLTPRLTTIIKHASEILECEFGEWNTTNFEQ